MFVGALALRVKIVALPLKGQNILPNLVKLTLIECFKKCALNFCSSTYKESKLKHVRKKGGGKSSKMLEVALSKGRWCHVSRVCTF